MAEPYVPQCGVYAIVSPSGRRYIGGSTDIKVRWQQHRCNLRGGRHHSKALQAEWGEYGEDGFDFVVLELVFDRAALLEREQHYFDRYGPGLLNDAPTASREGFRHTDCSLAKMKGRTVSVHSRALIAAAKMGNKHTLGQKRSPEMKALMSSLNVGSRHPRARLTEEAVVEIRRRVESGDLQRVIAKDFSVSQAIVSQVARRRRWAHVP